MESDLIGRRLGKYKILDKIGHGGMGSVYKGYDSVLDRMVAIKVLASHLVREEEFIERFMREARAAARLAHPNLVTIYDVGQEGETYYFVMEYLEGESLTQFIQKQGALPPEKALSFLHPLAEALDYAHEQGLVHRDVKPSNVVVGTTRRATLTDFGIARATQETRLTRTGTILGTPEYMSPEQVQGESVDWRSDQYSLAVVAYELLSGQVPFNAESTLALLHKVAYEPPTPINQVISGLPVGVEYVLNKALSKKPDDRYDSASDFVDALRRALSGEEIIESTKIMETEDTIRQPMPVGDTDNYQADADVSPERQQFIPVWAWILAGGAMLLLAVGLTRFISPGLFIKETPTATKTIAPTHTLTPVPSPTQTLEPTSTPAFSSLYLLDPNDGAEYTSTKQITLVWNWERPLNPDERFYVVFQEVTGQVVLTQTIAAGDKQEFIFTPEEEGLNVGRYTWRIEVQKYDDHWATSVRSDPRAFYVIEPAPTITPYGSGIILPQDLMDESPVSDPSSQARALAIIAPVWLIGFFAILELWSAGSYASPLARIVSVNLKPKR